MSTNRKKYFLNLALLMAIVAATSQSSYAFGMGDLMGTQDSLISKIASKFGLKVADVKTVFDDHRREVHSKMQEKMTARITAKLDELVKSGKITPEQKVKIIAKQKEMFERMQKEKESFKDLSVEQRKAKKDALRAELEKWAQDNGVDLDLLMPLGGMHGGLVGHGMGKHMWKNK